MATPAAGIMQNQKGLGELWTRLKFLFLAIIVYRVGSHIPVPGIDAAQLESIFNNSQNTIFGMANMFSGGALERMSVLALGVMPYISASIIVQLLTAVVPQLEQLKKEGESGRRKINQYTRYGTVLLASVQATGMVSSLASSQALYATGMSVFILAAVSLVTGSIFMMWLESKLPSAV